MYELKEYLKAINQSKEPLMDTEDKMWEKKYLPYVVNRCVYPFMDTILLVNEMNQYSGLDNKLQFHFLINSIRSKKRFAPWLKTSKIENLELIKEYFGYSDQKAKDVLNVLTDEDITSIQKKLNKGGNE
jgi:hypothetical protein|tara:strand:- start:2989 stop:3375 length:387 start_codon:yes stop_codon:yes gene_type:complete